MHSKKFSRLASGLAVFMVATLGSVQAQQGPSRDVVNTDRDFAQAAMTAGIDEVRDGRLAEQRGISATVRNFGRMLVNDHATSNTQLAAVANTNNIALDTSGLGPNPTPMLGASGATATAMTPSGSPGTLGPGPGGTTGSTSSTSPAANTASAKTPIMNATTNGTTTTNPTLGTATTNGNVANVSPNGTSSSGTRANGAAGTSLSNPNTSVTTSNAAPAPNGGTTTTVNAPAATTVSPQEGNPANAPTRGTTASSGTTTTAAGPMTTTAYGVGGSGSASDNSWKAVRGRPFDTAFMQHEVAAHQAAIALYKNEMTNGNNADLKAYAAAALPTLYKHLNAAQRFLGQPITPAPNYGTGTR